jgi:hypothetical protein
MIIRALALSLLLSSSACAVQESEAEETSDVRIIPTQICDGYFFVPVTLADREGYPDGRTLWFLHDTGASYSIVDPDSLERVSGTRVDSGDRVNIRDATSGPLTFNRLPVRARELDHLSRALGREIDGIMSFGALDDFLLTLDYGRGEMRIESGELPRPDNETVFNASGPDYRPWLRMRFSNRTRRLLIDSGAARSDIVVRDLDRFETVSPPRDTGAATRLTEIERRQAARARENVTFGDYVLQTPTLQSTPGTELFGGEVMKHFVWTFDQHNERVRILPVDPDQTITFEPVYGHGIVLGSHPDGFRIADIIDDTPAGRTDLQAGDIITHWNGAPVATRGCDRGDNQRLDLTIRRNGEILERHLELFPLVD